MYEVSGEVAVAHYLVIAEVRERLTVRNQAAQKFHWERFNLRKLNELEVRKEHLIEITNRFAAMQNLSDYEDINRAWESFKENIKTSAKESLGLHKLKQHKPWFDEESLGILDQRKQAKMQSIQDSSQSNVDSLNNIRRDAGRYFGNKRKVYLKAKIEELETNSKIKNIRDFYRGISDFNKGYQPIPNTVKNENCGLVADSHGILARWRNYFSQLLNVHGVKDTHSRTTST
jgi:hypothetical protein